MSQQHYPQPPAGPPGGGGPPGWGQPPGAGGPGPDGPGPGSAGWGAPVPPPQSGGGSKRGLLIVLAVVAIVGVGAAVLLTKDSGPDADSPIGTAEAFYDAASRGDCEAMVAMLSDATFVAEGAQTTDEAIADCQNQVASEAWPEDDQLDFELVSETDDAAVVNVQATIEGQLATLPLGLIREDGQWKIDSSQTDSVDGDDPTATAESETVVPSDGG